MIERTLSLIKPDAVQRNLTGEILMIQGAGLKVVALKMIHMTKAQAEGFYAVHRERPFFDSLTDYMSCPARWFAPFWKVRTPYHRYRELMGATNPEKAAEGTIRKKYAVSLEANSVHGSDAPETAAFETRYFFSAFEIV